MSSFEKPVLIFDFGGVLINWDPRLVYMKDFDGDVEKIDLFFREIDFYRWNYEQDKGRLFAEAVAELSLRFPQHGQLIKKYDECWEKSIVGQIQPSVDLLYSLKDEGFLLYGLTNWSNEKYQLVKGKFPFIDLFEEVLVSGKVGFAKPDPRIFDLTLDIVGRPAKDCVLIDDSMANVLAAQKSGMRAIHFVDANQLHQSLLEAGWVPNPN